MSLITPFLCHIIDDSQTNKHVILTLILIAFTTYQNGELKLNWPFVTEEKQKWQGWRVDESSASMSTSCEFLLLWAQNAERGIACWNTIVKAYTHCLQAAAVAVHDISNFTASHRQAPLCLPSGRDQHEMRNPLMQRIRRHWWFTFTTIGGFHTFSSWKTPFPSSKQLQTWRSIFAAIIGRRT